MQNCARCGHVIRTEVKTLDGDVFDTRCHRQYISDLYDAMTAEMPAKIAFYFSLSGGDREVQRHYLREFIADYRSLSY